MYMYIHYYVIEKQAGIHIEKLTNEPGYLILQEFEDMYEAC